jgi:single-strand DNA-binding protein
MNLNKALIIGRLTSDPELKTTAGGQSVVNIGVATNRMWRDKEGKNQEETQFHNIVIWGRQAEITSQFLRKGSLIFIEGRLQTRSWQDNQGQTRRTTEIVAEKIQLGPKTSGSSFSDPPLKPSFNNQKDKNQNEENLPEIHFDSEEEIKPEDVPF